MRHARHELQLHRYHDYNVKERSFNVGDLVLRRIQKTDGMHKLSAPWEGPFIVTEVIGPATYRLKWGGRFWHPEPMEYRPSLALLSLGDSNKKAMYPLLLFVVIE